MRTITGIDRGVILIPAARMPSADPVVCAETCSLDSITDQLLNAADLKFENLKIADSAASSFLSCEDEESSDAESDSLSSSEPARLPLRVRDMSSGGALEVHANTRAPFLVENDTCTGRAILKGVRTQALPQRQYVPF
jgi:hypothetical protein